VIANLPVNWRIVKLEDLCERITVGHVGSMADQYVEAGIPFLRSQDVIPFKIDLCSIKYIDDAFNQKLKKSILRPGDVVVVRTGYPGTAAMIPTSLPVSNCSDLVIITPSKALDPWYLSCLFNSIWGQGLVAGSLVGVAQQHFNVGAAKSLQIPLPPIEEQRRIATILSAYDDLIENNTRRIAILEEMARRLYEEWFVHFRFPGHAQARFKETELGRIPESWTPVILNDIVADIRDSTHPSQVDGDTPYVGLEHIPRRSITLIEWGNARDVDSTKLHFVRGDILFGKIRPYFHKVCVAPIDGICSSDTIVLRPVAPQYHALAMCLTSSDAFVDHATQSSNGTKMPRADWKVLKNYPLVLPAPDIQTEFNDNVAGFVDLARTLMLKNRNLRAQRDLLLPKLVSGELDVSDLALPAAKEAAAA
jgi:type I restriction enzyme, S subunit